MTENDLGLTKDVSSCEKLILLIRYAYHQYEIGELEAKLDTIRWEDIDRFSAKCDLLPLEFQDMLRTIEQFRP